MAEKRDAMRSEDRVAVKLMIGKGKKVIAIKALSIVKEVFEKRVYIDWKVTDLSPKVPAHGCFATIHGPYSVAEESELLGQVFRL